ncbi:hypothetical protein EVAR_17836_1 [Eumeta japonica]|uniref:Uncharacterized protein n=1 Tax=Eumeta variegata TaxID=151549 RepID=A0A4C1TTK3_EUMVA|nr:hypothetical protein EVAR_17836_1 [Eumeta japonica]
MDVFWWREGSCQRLNRSIQRIVQRCFDPQKSCFRLQEFNMSASEVAFLSEGYEGIRKSVPFNLVYVKFTALKSPSTKKQNYRGPEFSVPLEWTRRGVRVRRAGGGRPRVAAIARRLPYPPLICGSEWTTATRHVTGEVAQGEFATSSSLLYYYFIDCSKTMDELAESVRARGGRGGAGRARGTQSVGQGWRDLVRRPRAHAEIRDETESQDSGGREAGAAGAALTLSGRLAPVTTSHVRYYRHELFALIIDLDTIEGPADAPAFAYLMNCE